ncbi:MAG: prolipoprotein diacylglyceryl transferase, partial [Mycobacteriaceae bacterium]|nr:prolipoprotein diacylglyceryl transferase [Mycobacteriaceae bacterium]
MTSLLASFPSPPQGVWHVGFVPIRAYALFIIVGIIMALVIGDRRWVARGGEPGVIYDIALWAVPFGLIGGRLYHVMTDWKTYFGDDGAGLIAALKIWDGGLGIWGAVALGAVGAWIGCRQRGIPLPAFGDAIAPGIVLAQAVGRLGNYFNQELYGRPTAMPWGMKIYERRDASGAIDYLNGVSTGHVEKIVQPTFLYELIWDVLVFVVLIYADRRFKLGHGRLFASYVAAYCVGRFCVELLRDDTATHIAGIRINSFTSMFVFIGAVVYIVLAPKGREDPATLVGKPVGKPEEPLSKPAEVKEATPQKLKSAEESALVEWTKELAAVAATSGVVAGVAVAAEHDDADKVSADGEGQQADGEPESAAEPAEAQAAEASGEPEAGVVGEKAAEDAGEADAADVSGGEVDEEAEAVPEEALDVESDEVVAPEGEEPAESEQQAEPQDELTETEAGDEGAEAEDAAPAEVSEVTEGPAETEVAAEPEGGQVAEAGTDQEVAAEGEVAEARIDPTEAEGEVTEGEVAAEAEATAQPHADEAPDSEAETSAESESEQETEADSGELAEPEGE